MTTNTRKDDFQLILNFQQQLGGRRSTPFGRWRYDIRRLHSNKLKCKFLLYFGYLLWFLLDIYLHCDLSFTFCDFERMAFLIINSAIYRADQFG